MVANERVAKISQFHKSRLNYTPQGSHLDRMVEVGWELLVDVYHWFIYFVSETKISVILFPVDLLPK